MLDVLRHLSPLLAHSVAAGVYSAKDGLNSAAKVVLIGFVFVIYQKTVFPLDNFCPDRFTSLTGLFMAGGVFRATS